MTFTQAVRSVLSSYATFSGRARRSEFWWFYLFTILVGIATSIIDAVIDAALNNEIGIVGTITSLALLLPTLAVTSRRLHDTGRTGWWMLLPVVPLVATVVVGIGAVFAVLFSASTDSTPGLALIALLVVCVLLTLIAFIVLTVFLCLGSSPGPNKYGPPHEQPPGFPTGPDGYYPFPGYGPPSDYPQHTGAPGPYPSRTEQPRSVDGTDFDAQLVRLIANLDEIATLLRAHGESRWAGWAETCQRKFETHDAVAVDDVLAAFGGMGSLNDLLLLAVNGHAIRVDQEQAANARLDLLRHAIWDSATTLRQNVRPT